ncbi:MAG: zinc-dependent metalloprotease, partial [Candidatus Bathyarchaeia archaeon]
VQKSPEFIPAEEQRRALNDVQICVFLIPEGPAEEQRRALNLMLEALGPENLAIDERILGMIPPQPQGYSNGKDLFPGRTGLPFDSLAAAETSARICVDLLLHPDRATRLVEYHSRRQELPGFAEVVGKILNATWKTHQESIRYQEIQRVVDNLVLHKMMTLVKDNEIASGVREILYANLDELKKWLNNKIDSTTECEQNPHYLWGASMIKLFQEDPEKMDLTEPLDPPMGPPI